MNVEHPILFSIIALWAVIGTCTLIKLVKKDDEEIRVKDIPLCLLTIVLWPVAFKETWGDMVIRKGGKKTD